MGIFAYTPRGQHRLQSAVSGHSRDCDGAAAIALFADIRTRVPRIAVERRRRSTAKLRPFYHDRQFLGTSRAADDLYRTAGNGSGPGTS